MIVLIVCVGGWALIYNAIGFVARTPHSDAVIIAVLAAVLGWSALCFVLVDRMNTGRPTPDGYVGRFRRQPQDDIVHVARVNGRLMVISEEKPGVVPRDLGDVSGYELFHWDKLSATPDGNERITRPE